MRSFPILRSLVAGWIASVLMLLAAPVNAETYWLDSRADPNQTHYANSQEACLTGELQRRLDGYMAASSLPHRIISAYVGPDLGGEVICRGTLQKRQFNTWFGVEIVDIMVYGPNGSVPPCPLGGLADAETGQCGVPKCNSDCPADGGNQSNPIASATGNKRQRELDYRGAGVFPIEFVRYYNSHRVPDNRELPIGVGWTHSYAARVVPLYDGSDITSIRVYRPNGAIQTFKLVGVNWVGDADVPERLIASVTSGSLVSASYRRTDETVEAYDAFGRLMTVTSPEGFVQTLSYTAGSRVQRVTDPQGRAVTFGYSAAGQLTTLADSAGAVITFAYGSGDLVSAAYPGTSTGADTRFYHYNEAGQTGGISQPHLLTGITDENGGRYASWGYDASRRAVLSVHGPYATGTADRTSLQFNTNGSATITDSLGKARNYGFIASQGVARLTSLNSPCDGCANVAAARTYDANGYPASTTDFNGNVTQFTYGARGLETQRIESASDTAGNKRTQQVDWHPTFRQPAEQRNYDASSTLVAKGNWTYNSRGQVLVQTRTDPVSGFVRTITTAYCESAGVSAGTCPIIGLPISVDGPRIDISDVSAYTYYQADHGTCASSPATCPYRKGDLWKITNAVGQIIQITRYDATGKPLSIVSPTGVITDYSYHPRGWLVATKARGINDATEADDRITRFEYWPAGMVRKVTQSDGNFVSYNYDVAHRLTGIADNAGNTIQYTLDGAGNSVQDDIKDSGSVLRSTLNRIYSQLSRLETVADASANATDFAYDVNGNATSVADANLRTTQSEYDPLNRLKRTLEDVGGISAETKFKYDAQDNLTEVTDPKGLITTYAYDGLGQLKTTSSPDTGTTQRTYDAAGNLKTSTDARGIATSYSYDALSRVTAVGYPILGEDVTYTYDTVPVVCTAGEGFAAGQLSSMMDSSGRTDYCYSRFGNLVRKVQVTNGKTFVVRYSYTVGGNLASVIYPDGAVADYVRDGQGRIVEVGVTSGSSGRQVLLTGASYLPFGPSTGWQYGNGRALVRSYDLDYRPTAVVDSAQQLKIGLGYDTVSNVAALESGNYTAGLSYDALGRLKEFRDTAANVPIEQYSYDATGNRLSFTNAGTTTPYSYETSSHRLAAVGAVSRSYDAVGNTVGAMGGVKSFDYNQANRLSQVKMGGVATQRYAYNARGERVQRGLDAAGSVYTAYDEAGHWLGDYDSLGNAAQQVIWMDDLPVGLLAGGVLHYVEPDHLGTPRLVFNPVRNVPVWTWDIKGEAFGSSVPNQDPDGDAQDFVFDMRFPGQRFDVVSGLNYNHFRDYDPSLGRYVQSDPIGLGGGISTYGYVSGSPLAGIDPEGLACRSAAGLTLCEYPNGPIFVLPTPSDFQDFDVRDVLYHNYDITRDLGCAEPGAVMQALVNHPTPSPYARPATLGGTAHNDASVLGRGNNLVTSYVTTDLRNGNALVVNITARGSMFSPGYVARTVNGGVAHTYGEGANWSQHDRSLPGALANKVANEVVWGRQMEKMIEQSAKRCGCQ